MKSPRAMIGLVLLLGLLVNSGCSVRRLAVNRVADALTGGGSAFTSDNDPELVRDALPFSLKLMESLLAESPNHLGLLTTLGSGFTMYGYAFVQQEAERLEEDDLERSRELRERAQKLYVRGRDYCLRGLEVRHRGFGAALAKEPGTAMARLEAADMTLLYWASASWAAAIAQAKDDPALVGDLPKVEAMLARALELDEAWNQGSVHELMIPFSMSRTTGSGDPVEAATRHFERARQLGKGRSAGALVSYAEAVCVAREDRAGFERLLREALAVDVNTVPERRVETLVVQRRAKWLLGRIDKLFLPPLQ
ncbi:MAG: TRAP transporter TatT component family protein [Verrucomicrobiales bacterium]|nr:TRAP transporter TatT component family protein [Verrucomicrobiales bacterium]